jgi:hypothetical protein
MDSDVKHPNIFGYYICASILNTHQGYTSAYTLKAIAIQMLSFFGSDSIEQVGSGVSVQLNKYRDAQNQTLEVYHCEHCQFGSSSPISIESDVKGEEKCLDIIQSLQATDLKKKQGRKDSRCRLIDATIPDENLLLLFEQLDGEDLISFARA